MILHKREVQNNTPDEARGYLADALALTVELDPPEDLRPHLFVQAVALLSGKQIVLEQMNQLPNGMALPR